MQCKHCGNYGSSLSDIGLCNNCDYIFRRNVKILTESADILNEVKNITTFINRCNVSLGVLETLKKFQHLNYIDPSPSQLVAEIIEKRSATIFNHWESHFIELSQKLESYSSTDKIIKTIEKSKNDFIKYEKLIQHQRRIADIKSLIKSLVDNHVVGRYNDLVHKAREYEKASNKKLCTKTLKKAIMIFEKNKNYFGEGNQSLGTELKEWIERLEV